MGAEEDGRYQRAQQAICAALARLLREKPLSEVTMSDVARAASVSRSTLYAHFGNVTEVYQLLVEDFQGQSQTFDEHFRCGCEGRTAARPWCECVRDAGDYEGVVADGSFLPTALGLMGGAAPQQGAVERLVRAGLPDDVAQAVVLFQMSGCHAVATSDLGRRGDWARFQGAIDRFIQGGMEALGVAV